MPLAMTDAWAPAWHDLPVAESLHPVVPGYGARYQELLVSTMGGPTGSPSFGPVVAQADVHWRLVAATGYGLPLGTADDARWRDTALSGATIALDALLDDTLSRAPQIDVLRTAVDTVLAPSLEARGSGDGEVRVRPGAGLARARVDRTDADFPSADATRWEARRRQVTRPTVRAGIDWSVRPPDAPTTEPLLGYGAYLSTTRVVVTRLRADLDATDLTWSVSARHEVYPRVSLVGSVRSTSAEDAQPNAVPTLAPPGRLAGGLLYVTPNGWELRGEHALQASGEWTWTVSARCERRTPVPITQARSPGARHDAPDLPAVAPTGPNDTNAW
jgi:hypothetical protein